VEVDVGTRAALKLALLPPGSLLLLLLIGWLFARRFFGRLLILVAIVALYALSTPVGVDWLAARVETVPALTPAQLKDGRAQAILALMADARRDNPEFGGAEALAQQSLERIDYALYLHRQTGLPIVLSGGSANGDRTPLAQLGAAWLKDRAGVTVLAIDDSSRDTWQNARHSAAVLRRLGLDRVLLVTHAFHMPRALFSARAAGIDVLPAPFGFMHVTADRQRPGEVVDWLPHPGYLGRSYLLLHEMAGLVWYRLTFD
jgi:uncharacterized SAM-binding protein YcdF (DUF218 family)